MIKPFLRIDDTLTLHLARHELADAIYNVVDSNREHLRRWLPWVDTTKSVDDTKAFIRESMTHNSKGTKLSTFILEGEKLVGSVGVVRFNKDCRNCEIGYWLIRESTGQGIMTKAVGCLVNYLFQKKSMHRIEIKMAAGNLKSRQVPIRLGFTFEGTHREELLLYGAYHDVDYYGLLKAEWEAPKQ